ncbi:hypothetical protein [uncultured Anaerococcus sp.]|uniref:hypothetical protein n=1 Tax=uncultured Anaerococcus sp. TaxID=293428 RepID=UPI00288B5C04|nr:hypothetical protein [uncultured Anaerococcus sp.]
MIDSKKAERLYQLILKDDECLMGSQWDEILLSEQDTPQSIINELTTIFIDTEFREYDHDLDKDIRIANRKERKEALIKFFEHIVEGLKEE